MVIIFSVRISAQDVPVMNYLQQAGIYAGIYNGKREVGYNASKYENLPYYRSPDFTNATIIYRKNRYPDLKARLDLYEEQLVVFSPEKQFKIILNPQYVEEVQMYDKTFVWLNPPKKSKLKPGYYTRLHAGKKMQLLCKDEYIPSKTAQQDAIPNYFLHKSRYYLFYNNRYYAVKNEGAFSGIFPQYKKQISVFVSDNKLNFKKDTEESVVSLTGYIETLISTNPDYPEINGTSAANNISFEKSRQDTFYNASNLFQELDTTLSPALTCKPEPQDTALEAQAVPEKGNRTEKETPKIAAAISENLIYPVGDTYRKTIPDYVTLRGKVIDSKTELPLPGVNIMLKEPHTVATTDVKGNYAIRLPSGRVQLEISGMNINTSRRQLQLYGDGALNIELAEEPQQLEEVTVTAQRVNNVRNIQLGTEKVQIPQIKNIPAAFGEADILSVIQSLPGVKTVGEASSGYNVRGGATDQNLILFNDGTIYNPNHLFGLFSAFNSDMIKEAELYKSSIPAKYGGRISSVLDINGKEANKEKFTGSAGLGLITSKLTLEIPVIKGKTSVLLSGRTTYSDYLLKLLPEKSGYSNGTAGFYDVGTVLSHKFNEKNYLTVFGYYSRDRFSFSGNQQYAYSNMNASAKWKHFFNDRSFVDLTFGYDHYDYLTSADENADSTAYMLSFNIDHLFIKSDFTYDLGRHILNFGLKSMFYDLNPGTFEPYGDNSKIKLDRLQNEKALESALYLEDQWDLTDRFSVTAGVRFSMFNAFGPRNYYTYDPGLLPDESTITGSVSVNSGKVFKTYAGPEFRLSSRYILAENLSVKAGFNTMQQYIHKLSNTAIMSPTDTWKLSDANIRPQKGWQAATGFYYDTPRKTYLLSVEGYYKKLSDYLDYRSGAQILMNHHIETDVINTEGYAYGAEFSLKKPEGKLNGWLSYTYSRTFLRQSDKLIANPVNDGSWYPTDYDKPHDFKLVGNYRFTKRYSCSVNLDYSTGRPITIPAGKYYDATSDREFAYYTDRNTYRIPDYFRMDIAFNIEPSHKLTLLTHSSISFGVYNVTGRQNAYSIYYVSEKEKEGEPAKIKGYKLSIFGAPIPFITYNIKF
jgi:hypothetical protein